jgi:hypothetical protein
MFYGGALLADLAFTDVDPLFSDEFIEILKINSNAFVIIDSDITPARPLLREYKKRVHAEIGENRCWITSGKEIENYLRPELIQAYLNDRFPGQTKALRFKSDDVLEKAMRMAVKGGRIKYDKVRDAKKFTEAMTLDDLDVGNLKTWIKRIIAAIKEWN